MNAFQIEWRPGQTVKILSHNLICTVLPPRDEDEPEGSVWLQHRGQASAFWATNVIVDLDVKRCDDRYSSANRCYTMDFRVMLANVQLAPV